MSIKKSSLLVLALVVAVTLFSFVADGGNAMCIHMGETTISFSGIEDFCREVAYSDILSAELDQVSDWSVWKGETVGHFRVGETEECILFLSTQTDRIIVATLADGRHLVFNYNNASDTQALYDMLLKNLN